MDIFYDSFKWESVEENTINSLLNMGTYKWKIEVIWGYNSKEM